MIVDIEIERSCQIKASPIKVEADASSVWPCEQAAGRILVRVLDHDGRGRDRPARLRRSEIQHIETSSACSAFPDFEALLATLSLRDTYNWHNAYHAYAAKCRVFPRHHLGTRNVLLSKRKCLGNHGRIELRCSLHAFQSCNTCGRPYAKLLCASRSHRIVRDGSNLRLLATVENRLCQGPPAIPSRSKAIGFSRVVDQA